MKNIVIFFLIILCLFINYKSKKNINKLNNTIKQQDKHFNSLYLEKKIDDSICKKIWESLPLGPPLKFIIVNSKFGLRKDPFSRRYTRHDGLDLKGTKKDTVFSTGAGFVEMANYYGGYGKCVIINHGRGYKSMYAHLSKIFINKTEYINDNQPIGKIGNTGHSTGNHLHYEIIKNGKPINPEKFILIKQ